MNIRDLVKGIRKSDNAFCRNSVVCIGMFMLVFALCSTITPPVLEGAASAALKAPDTSLKVELGPDEDSVAVDFRGWVFSNAKITAEDIIYNINLLISGKSIKSKIVKLKDLKDGVVKGKYKFYLSTANVHLDRSSDIYGVGVHKERYAYSDKDINVIKTKIASYLDARIKALEKKLAKK